MPADLAEGGGDDGAGDGDRTSFSATTVVKLFETTDPSKGEISERCGVPPRVLAVMTDAHAALHSMAQAIAAVGGLSSSSSSSKDEAVPRAAMSLAAGSLAVRLHIT